VRPLEGRVAVVTGASRGIGATVARRLARDGARVAVVARSEAELVRLADEIGGLAIVADVTAAGASEHILREASALGDVDIVVPNAGVEASHRVDAITDAIWDDTLALNATAVFRLLRAALPPMVARGRGRVVVVASNAGLAGYAYTAAYCAAKHAVVGLVRALAVEIAKSGVTINAVCPGFVETEMADRAIARIVEKTGRDAATARAALAALSPQKRLIAPQEVAHVVASLCADEARGVHGQAIAIDGGQTNG
jgi:NAD(P)-dependent dehydrogenase (short-subunit alcohol dehydrogenase family)